MTIIYLTIFIFICYTNCYRAQYSRTMFSLSDYSTPKFDGHSLSLKCFFNEVDYLGDFCGLSVIEKIQHTLHYLDFREYET